MSDFKSQNNMYNNVEQNYNSGNLYLSGAKNMAEAMGVRNVGGQS